jgi:beta-lactamase class D
MKTIEPVQVWYNGQEVNATVFNAYVTDLRLNVSANFSYQLFLVNENNMLIQVNYGNITMSGQDYQDWDQDSFAWDWLASSLNLTITGEYIPPMPPPPTL